MDTQSLSKLTYIGIGAIALGVFVSVTVPSLFHMLTIVPAFVINWQLYKANKLKLPSSAWVLILMILWAYVSNIVNFDILNSPLRSFGKPKYWWFGVLSIGLFQVVFNEYINTFRAKRLLNIFWFTIISAALYGLYKDFPERISGFTGTMRYGYGMSFVITIMFGMHLHREKLTPYISKKLFYTAIVFGVTGFLATKTRGALLGLLASIPFIIYYKNKLYGKIAAFIISILLVIIVAISINGGHSSLRIFEKIGNSSNIKRFSQYETAAVAVKENPFFGVGVNNFSSMCPSLKDEHEITWYGYCERYPSLNCNYHKEDLYQYCGHAHNIVLETAANIGIVGGVLIIIWLLLWLYELVKTKNLLSILLIPFLINVVVAGQFENVFDANNSFLIFFLYSLSFLENRTAAS